MSNASNNLRIAYYGDDFTGSTDAMESLTLAGVRTALFVEPPDAKALARFPGLRGVGVAGLTRSMAPDAMEAELRPALAKLRALGAPVVHYKVCSTFDSSPTVGSIGRAIDVGRTVFPEARFVPLVVAAPHLGRYCVFGNLFARFGTGGEAHRLDRHPSMGRHPVTPADESDIRLHLRRQTAKRVSLFEVLNVAMPESLAREALTNLLEEENPDVVLFDALYSEHIERIGSLMLGFGQRDAPLFVVGSSGATSALGEHWRARGESSPPTAFASPGPARPLLVASGSCSPVTAGQIEWATASGFAEVALDVAAVMDADAAEAALRRATDAVIANLAAGRHTIVHTSRGTVTAAAAPAEVLGRALGTVARAAVTRTGVRRLLVAGGDTSGYLARALGIEALEMIAPLTPGAPLCRASAAPGSPADGLEVNFKGGQVGSPDYFGRVADGRSAS